MSSDLIEDIEDKKGASIMLAMKASGHAILTIMEENDIHYEMGGEKLVADFRLPPTEDGIRLAEKIIAGLVEWQRVAKEIVANKENNV